MMIGYICMPFIFRHRDRTPFAIPNPLDLCSSKCIYSSVKGVMQNGYDTAGIQGKPDDFPCVSAGTFPDRKRHVMVTIIPGYAGCCFHYPELPEQLINSLPYLQIVCFYDTLIQVEFISDWEESAQFAALCLVQQPAPHPFLKEMEFGFAHCALHA